jgi:hypothetical protein
MTEFKVVYKDGRTRIVPADKYGRSGDIYWFTRDGRDILTIDADTVESVGEADLLDPKSRAPRSAAV